jgi:3-oxoacyl-[acyl-carrier-protein] synthase II
LFDADERFSTRIACEVDGFDPVQFMDKKEARRFDRFAQFALATAVEAMSSAGLDGVPPGTAAERCGVVFGSGVGGMNTMEQNARAIVERGPHRVSPFFVPMFIPDIAAGLISIRYGLKGVNYATVSACASGAHAIGEAYRSIQRGDSDLVVAGGTEAAVTPLTIAGFGAMKAMSSRNDDPQRASRPFDADRDGFVIGEGAGALILESEEHARARGADIVAEVAGYGASGDAYHITSPAPAHEGAQAAMRAALADSMAIPADVDYINAHGTSTPLNDQRETEAIRAVFGESADDLIVSSTKSATGHLLGASGALEAVFSALACRDGVIPPTINFETPDPACDLDYATNGAVEKAVGLALSNSFGFGGHNVCLAYRRWDE